jgi:glycosyltransferase involved in cell wall biosynthesis
MKILITCENYLPRVGGAEIHVSNLFNRIKKDGHQVSLLTNEKGQDEEFVTRILWSRKNAFKLVRAVWKMSKGVDIIHAHYCHRLAFIASVVGRLKGIPVIITLHGMGILDHPGAKFWARTSHGFYRYWSLKFCTHVISTSEDLALVADRFISRRKLEVVMNGYDASIFYEKNFPKVVLGKDFSDKKIILTVRRLVPKNGLHYLIEAMPYILERIPNAHYVLAGDGTLRPHIESRVSALSLQDHVTFLGMVDNHLVHEYMAFSDVLAFPSTAESSSIACAEAMGMKKIVVASRVGGLVELIGKNEERGYLVDLVPWEGSNYDAPLELPVERYKALADKITEAIENVAESEQKAAKGALYAKSELSWDSIYQKTVNVYLNKLK